MAQAFVDASKSTDTVFFLAYRHPRSTANVFYCCACIDKAVGYELTREEETEYIVTGEISLEHFTEKHHSDKSNYCATCNVPLYDLIEECQQLKPTSSKWRNRFQKKKRYGLPGGGI